MKFKSLFILTIVAFFGCTKDNANNDQVFQLPPETQIGANTFGCLINGKLLIPRDGIRGLGRTGMGMFMDGGYPNGTDYNEIVVRDYKSFRSGSITIHIQSLVQLGEGNYIIDESNGQSSIDGLNHNYLHCSVFDPLSNTYKFYKSFENCGVIKITKFIFTSGVSSTISGIFSCRVKNANNPADEIEITSGRFDINGYTLPLKIFP